MKYLVHFLLVIFGNVLASPKKYNADQSSFQLSNNRYYESNLPSILDPYNGTKAEQKNNPDRLRFGVISNGYGNTGGGVQYQNGGVGYMISPMKIDIGGIALGALIGLGAILLVPKLAHAFSGTYGGYRSLENEMSSITEALARIDNTLEQHNIDSSSCMQRIICSYVHEAQKNIDSGSPNTVDQIIHTVSNNSLFTYLLDGSAIKQAIDMGREGDSDKCSSLYTKCPVNKENIMKVISTLLPAK